jgi:hypothetical protein
MDRIAKILLIIIKTLTTIINYKIILNNKIKMKKIRKALIDITK